MNHSKKTKAGIAKAKAAGASWGRQGSVLAKKNQGTAQKFAESLRPLILELMLSAKTAKGRNLAALAEKLNSLEIPTARGWIWHPATVHRLKKLLEPELSESFNKADEVKAMKFLKENLKSGIAGYNRHNG